MFLQQGSRVLFYKELEKTGHLLEGNREVIKFEIIKLIKKDSEDVIMIKFIFTSQSSFKIYSGITFFSFPWIKIQAVPLLF